MNRLLATSALIVALPVSGCSRDRPGTGAPADSVAAPVATLTAPRPAAATLAACLPAEGMLRAWHGARVTVDSAFDLASRYGGKEPRIGCRVLALGTSTTTSTSLDSIALRYRAAGWRPALALDADGPDGSIAGFQLNGITCLLEGQWDGGDDSDPAYVPSDSMALSASCAPTLARDTL